MSVGTHYGFDLDVCPWRAGMLSIFLCACWPPVCPGNPISCPVPSHQRSTTGLGVRVPTSGRLESYMSILKAGSSRFWYVLPLSFITVERWAWCWFQSTVWNALFNFSLLSTKVGKGELEIACVTPEDRSEMVNKGYMGADFHLILENTFKNWYQLSLDCYNLLNLDFAFLDVFSRSSSSRLG